MLRQSALNISINTENKEVPLYLQVSNKVKEMIRTGILKPGEALPGSRELAVSLNVSRKTTLRAMEILVAEGWLEMKDRVGVFVSNAKGSSDEEKTIETSMSSLVVDDGSPDTKLLPYLEYSRFYRQALIRAAKWRQMGICSPKGNENLRNILSASMCHERGVNINNEEILITQGSQMALYLISQVLLKKGDTVVMENPCNKNAYDVFVASGMNVVQIEVDDEGISIDRLRPILEVVPVKAIYLTPRFQYPTNVTLSITRRHRLAEMIKKYNLLLIEDDFGCMFKYRGSHLLPLSHYLNKENFVYVGTFSKIFDSYIRIGYVAASEKAINKMADYRRLIDLQGDKITERTLFELIDSGVLRRHVRSAGKIYGERLNKISSLINENLAGKVIYKKPSGGLSIWIQIIKRITRDQLEEILNSRGIQMPLFELTNGKVGIRIGFATLSDNDMIFLVNVLKSIL